MFAYLPLAVKLYILAIALVTGTIMGSGLNCLAYRMVRRQSWAGGRSRCPRCSHVLAAKDLIPVLSYVTLKGKCRYCGGKMDRRYVLTEAFLGLCYVTLVLRFGLSFDTLTHLVLVSCLFTLSLVDLDTQIIPDRFLVIPALFRLLQLGIEGNLLSGLVPAFVFGGGLLVLSLVMDKILGKDSMGGGDIKLMALLGLFFPVPQCLLLLILACFTGIIMASILMKIKDDTPFPFGPALSLAAWITMLIGEKVISWYLSLF